MEQSYLRGTSVLELIPQGTLAEKIRSCGAGIPAFFTPIGLHTVYADGKLPIQYNTDGSVACYNRKLEVHNFGGRPYLLENAFEMADFAWIKASKADRMDNCVFNGTSYDFNGIMAREYTNCCLVEVGAISPEQVHLPGLYVDLLFRGARYEHRIEVLKFTYENSSADGLDMPEDPRELIAQVAAQEFEPGMKCNLGVGIPTMVTENAASMGVHVFLQSENGVTGCSPYPAEGKQDSYWINAGKESIKAVPGVSTFGSDEIFGQIRGGHLDMTVLVAFECSHKSDLANFMIPSKMVKGMGGAMAYLVWNPQHTKVAAVQTHVDKQDNPKIKEECRVPITGARCVQKTITDLAVFDVDVVKGLTLIKNPASSIDEIRRKTGAPFDVAVSCKPWNV